MWTQQHLYRDSVFAHCFCILSVVSCCRKCLICMSNDQKKDTISI